MIDLKKLKSNAEYLEKTCDGAYVEIPTADVLELISLLEQAQKDAARWVYARENIDMSHSDDLIIEFINYQNRKAYCNTWPRCDNEAAIDAAMQSEKGE